jgi:signal transduction histidine kinase
MTPDVVGPKRLRSGTRHPLPDAQRASQADIERQAALVARSPIVAALLDAVDAALLVLNAQRQVVAWNGSRREGGPPFGLRVGEVLGCENARGVDGCGTSAACASCGALGAILGCDPRAGPLDAPCVMPVAGGAARELDVRAIPVRLGDERFTVVALRDVSVEKRREALEQIFFHDILNTTSGIRGWAWHLRRDGADVRRAGERIDLLSRQLEREIRDHQALVLAEQGALVPTPALVRACDLVDDVVALFSQHAAARDRTLEISSGDPDLALETDRALLARVLVNMVRNALEATAPGGTVLLSWSAEAGEERAVHFCVRNAGEIPAQVQERIFQRSFSTKGRGRGLGTYGMKLIGERTLGGSVSFVSTAEGGTLFAIRVPARLPGPGSPGEPGP